MDFISVEDFDRDGYERLFQRANVFQDAPTSDVPLCAAGKVLGCLFFEPSTRTAATHCSAMASLGGSWISPNRTPGSYEEFGLEDVEDEILSYAAVCDLLVIRHTETDPARVVDQLDIPVINGQWGSTEHATGAAGFVYSCFRALGGLKGKRLGFYGPAGASRQIKATYKLLREFDVEIVEDPVIDEFETEGRYNSAVERDDLDNFLGDIDLLFVDGLVQKGTDRALEDKFNAEFEVLTQGDLQRLRDDCSIFVEMPRFTSDGRVTVPKSVDQKPRAIHLDTLRDWRYVIMSLLVELLDIELTGSEP